VSYTHTWQRIETPAGWLPPEPHHAYGQLALDAMRLAEEARRRGIPLGNGRAEPGTRPEVSEGEIRFNGSPDQHAASFVWPARPALNRDYPPGHRGLDFCDTNYQPYDALVCAVLIRAHVHYGASLVIGSDGEWDGTSQGGIFYPEWLAGRDLVHAVCGPEGAPCPLRYVTDLPIG
jgi:hypothetical protein